MAYTSELPSAFPKAPLDDDVTPKTEAQLCAGDIVLTAFSHALVNTSGAVAARILPLVRVEAGVQLNFIRYSRSAAPTTGPAAGILNSVTTSAQLERGVLYEVRVNASVTGLDLVVATSGAPVGQSGMQSWGASNNNDDTIMLYVRSGIFTPIHAIGFYDANGEQPNFGFLCRDATVTLDTPSSLNAYEFARLGLFTYDQAAGTPTTLVLPAAGLRRVVRDMCMIGSAAMSVATLTSAAQQCVMYPDVGSMVFTQYFLGGPSTGFTRWEVLTLQPIARGARIRFNAGPLGSTTSALQRAAPHTFSIDVLDDMAAGESLRISTGLNSSSIATVVLKRRKVDGTEDDWSTDVDSDLIDGPASGASSADVWTSVYVTAEGNATLAEHFYTVTALHTRDAPVSLLAHEADLLPRSAVARWNPRSALLPNRQLKMSAWAREVLRDAEPQAASTGVLIV